MQLGPLLLAGLPHDAPKAAPRVAQGGHEQAGFAVPLGAWHPSRGALTVVDLHLLAGQEGQAVELLGLAHPGARGKALDRVVAPDKTVRIDQFLVDGRGVAAQLELGFDEGAVRLAQRCTRACTQW